MPMIALTHTTTLAILAILVRDCTTEGSPLTCKLASVLHGLETVAVVLGLLLLLVVSAAMLVYRRKKCDRSSIL